MSTDYTKGQRMAAGHNQFAEQNPEWAEMSLKAINLWGTGEVSLMVAVGEALKTAWGMGRMNEYPESAKPSAPAIVRRTRPQPTPPARTVIRRHRT